MHVCQHLNNPEDHSLSRGIDQDDWGEPDHPIYTLDNLLACVELLVDSTEEKPL